MARILRKGPFGTPEFRVETLEPHCSRHFRGHAALLTACRSFLHWFLGRENGQQAAAGNTNSNGEIVQLNIFGEPERFGRVAV